MAMSQRVSVRQRAQLVAALLGLLMFFSFDASSAPKRSTERTALQGFVNLINKNMEEKDAQKSKKKWKFAAALNCMDGRAQPATLAYMKKYFKVDWVDAVTEPGINKILADNTDKAIVENTKKRMGISVHHHGAKVIALVAHDECAGNPTAKEQQVKDLRMAKKTVESWNFGIEVIMLWVEDPWMEAQLVK